MSHVPAGTLGRTVIDADQLAAKVRSLGAEITADYAGRQPLLVGVLKGAFIFMSDLAREIELPVEFDFMAVSSYGDSTTTSGVVRIVKDLETEFPHCVQVCKRGYDFVVIDIHDATYIPYELLLAETENLPTRILRTVPIDGLQGTVDGVNQALNAFGTMEGGVDVAFRTRSAKDIKEIGRAHV